MAFHFLRASCFHRIRSLKDIKGGMEKSRLCVQQEVAMVARHVNAGVYNNAICCICCAPLAVAQGRFRDGDEGGGGGG